MLSSALDRLGEPGRGGARRIVMAGGKRLRPDLLVRCASLGGGLGPFGLHADAGHRAATLAAAAAIELLHSATLVHDDLLDGAEMRRGVAAVHRAEGINTAVIAGDALIAQSWRAIAGSGSADVEDLADALADMCSGEELEAALAFDPAARPLDVLRVAQLKTGALLRAACQIGGRRAGLPDHQVRALGAFGSDFGLALQLVDDVLDVASQPALLGKPCGADFVAGIVTMPTVYALTDRSRGAEILRLFRPGVNASEADQARQLVLAAGGAERAAELARSFARRASTAMSSVAASAPIAGSAAALEAARALAAIPVSYVDAQLRSRIAAGAEWPAPPTPAEDAELLTCLDGYGSVAG